MEVGADQPRAWRPFGGPGPRKKFLIRNGPAATLWPLGLSAPHQSAVCKTLHLAELRKMARDPRAAVFCPPSGPLCGKARHPQINHKDIRADPMNPGNPRDRHYHWTFQRGPLFRYTLHCEQFGHGGAKSLDAGGTKRMVRGLQLL